jgi:outer membrane receptor protein involved in Fe transport
MIGRWIAALLAALVLSMLALPVQAAVTGTVRGTVTIDGAATPGVRVTLAGEGTTATTTTDAAGRFTFQQIAFGRYTVRAESAGKPAAQSDVDVSTDSVSNVALAIGAAAEIGRTVATTRGVGGNPVSVSTFTSADIAAMPQAQSLNRLVETVPGIVQFSYDEPVAHGFHGVTYEVDGAPVPLTTSSNFSELIDPRNIDSLEIFTGAFPAEFGGQRAGAVVNIVTKRDIDIPNGSLTQFSAGIGTYGTSQYSFSQASRIGSTDVFLDANTQGTNRGLDAPTQAQVHDGASLSDLFLRTITNMGPHDTLAFNYSNQFNTYQIPINPSLTPVDSIVNVPGQDDVQLEYTSFGSANYTHTSGSGAYAQVIPWFRSSRVVYAGDLANDVLALDYSPSDCAPAAPPCSLDGLDSDRRATSFGLRTVYGHDSGSHAFKAGIEASAENFTSAETIVTAGAAPFLDNTAQHGSAYDAYAQDKWTPTAAFSLQVGLRYDESDGFVQGNQVQPRIGANLRVAPDTTFHVYYGRLYAAPSLEDTRRDADVVGGGSPSDALPVYDLKPSTESYYEAGLAHTFGNGIEGDVNAWQRNVWNVLDTTQIFPTPIFAVFNNALGLAHGFELRLEGRKPNANWYFSGTFSQSVAGGISGGTFLFPPDVISDTSLQPEDHDQTVAIKDGYAWKFGRDGEYSASVGSDYGTGYPIQFQNGSGRLLPHLTFDASIGRKATPHRLGVALSVLNLSGYQYLIKVNNGFNTTQWSAGAQGLLTVTAVM